MRLRAKRPYKALLQELQHQQVYSVDNDSLLNNVFHAPSNDESDRCSQPCKRQHQENNFYDSFFAEDQDSASLLSTQSISTLDEDSNDQNDPSLRVKNEAVVHTPPAALDFTMNDLLLSSGEENLDNALVFRNQSSDEESILTDRAVTRSTAVSDNDALNDEATFEDVAALLGLPPVFTFNSATTIQRTTFDELNDISFRRDEKKQLEYEKNKNKPSISDKERSRLLNRVMELLHEAESEKRSTEDEQHQVPSQMVEFSNQRLKRWFSFCRNDDDHHLIKSILEENNVLPALRNVTAFVRLFLTNWTFQREDEYLNPLCVIVASMLKSHHQKHGGTDSCFDIGGNGSHNSFNSLSTSGGSKLLTCPNCNSHDIELDRTTRDSICQQCGDVVQSELWDSSATRDCEANEEREWIKHTGLNFVSSAGQSFRAYSSTDRYKRQSERNRQIRIHTLCKSVGIVEESDIQQIEASFCRYFDSRPFPSPSLSLFKKVIVALCFITLRRKGEIVTISTIATRAGIHTMALRAIVSRAAVVLGVRDLPKISPESFIDDSIGKLLSRFNPGVPQKNQIREEDDELVDDISGSAITSDDWGNLGSQHLSLDDLKGCVESVGDSNQENMVTNPNTFVLTNDEDCDVLNVNVGDVNSDSLLDSLFADLQQTPQENQSERFNDFLSDVNKASSRSNQFELSKDGLLIDSTSLSPVFSLVQAAAHSIKTEVPVEDPVGTTFSELSLASRGGECPQESPSCEQGHDTFVLFWRRMATSPKVAGLFSEEKLCQLETLTRQLLNVYLKSRAKAKQQLDVEEVVVGRGHEGVRPSSPADENRDEGTRVVGNSNNESTRNVHSIPVSTALGIQSRDCLGRRLKFIHVEDESSNIVTLIAASVSFSSTFLRAPIQEKQVLKALDLRTGSFSRAKLSFIEHISRYLESFGLLDHRLVAGKLKQSSKASEVRLIVPLVQSNYKLLMEED